LYTGGYTNNTEELDVDLPQCPKDSLWGDVAVCGDWMIDPYNGSAPLLLDKASVRASYCPEVSKGSKRWNDCETQGAFYVTYWLNYSSRPNQIAHESLEKKEEGKKKSPPFFVSGRPRISICGGFSFRSLFKI
ncbi:MAG: hypothetical protein IKR09_03475, partial [Alphaproteobacteria bacterium]|nr:hypothetical protein [Alphaproteobacteria bacterium]